MSKKSDSSPAVQYSILKTSNFDGPTTDLETFLPQSPIHAARQSNREFMRKHWWKVALTGALVIGLAVTQVLVAAKFVLGEQTKHVDLLNANFHPVLTGQHMIAEPVHQPAQFRQIPGHYERVLEIKIKLPHGTQHQVPPSRIALLLRHARDAMIERARQARMAIVRGAQTAQRVARERFWKALHAQVPALGHKMIPCHHKHHKHHHHHHHHHHHDHGHHDLPDHPDQPAEPIQPPTEGPPDDGLVHPVKADNIVHTAVMPPEEAHMLPHERRAQPVA